MLFSHGHLGYSLPQVLRLLLELGGFLVELG